jgi:hypothetical protein
MRNAPGQPATARASPFAAASSAAAVAADGDAVSVQDGVSWSAVLSGLERQGSGVSSYLWERKGGWETGRQLLLREIESSVGSYWWAVRRATKQAPVQVPRSREVRGGAAVSRCFYGGTQLMNSTWHARWSLHVHVFVPVSPWITRFHNSHAMNPELGVDFCAVPAGWLAGDDADLHLAHHQRPAGRTGAHRGISPARAAAAAAAASSSAAAAAAGTAEQGQALGVGHAGVAARAEAVAAAAAGAACNSARAAGCEAGSVQGPATCAVV